MSDPAPDKWLGRPPRTSVLSFAPPDISDDEVAEVTDTLRSGWLTTGPKTQRFERQFAEYVGSGHAVGLNSATAGLFLCLRALDIGPGDEVITTPYTFAATVNVILHAGATPVLADVEPDTGNIDPDRIAAAVTPRTRAVIPVHFAGRPCRMDRIGEIAARHGLTVIEDAAHAIGAEFGGRRIGAISRLTVFSLHAVKNVTTGEGGMVTTDDGELAQRIRTLALHGMDKDAWQRFAPGAKWKYDIVVPGYKYNLMDLQSAIGIHQLRRVEGFLAKRMALVGRYRQGLEGLTAVGLPADCAYGRHAWHLFPALLDPGRLSVGRDRFIELMAERKVSTNVHYQPVHLFSYYRSLGFGPGQYPVAESLGQREVTLPLYTRMTDGDVDDVVAAVRSIVNAYCK